MFSRMNPTLRGFLIIAAIALVVIMLNLYVALASLLVLAQIGFFLAIAFFIYLLWRERRDDIGVWPMRAKFAFYGGALLILVAIGVFVLDRPAGFQAIAFLATVVFSGFAMWRTWRDQHTYS
jgi:ABC-type branched-subunit amino acid transport system permease subunit